MNRRTFALIMQVVTVIFFIVAFRLLFSLITDSSQKFTQESETGNSVKRKLISSAVIDSALSEKIVPKRFEYKEDLKSPFSKLDAKPVVRRSAVKKVAKVERVKIFLKGILDKKNALAILEDKSGKTYICKKGDQVYNWTVSEISDRHVVIRDGAYKEVLQVKGR